MQEGAGGPGTDGEGGWVIPSPLSLSLSLTHAHTHTERARERRESLVVGSVCECLVQCTDKHAKNAMGLSAQYYAPSMLSWCSGENV